jgi:L-asparaginase
MDGHPLKPMSSTQFRALLSTLPGFSKKTITFQNSDAENFVIDYVLDAFEIPIDSSSMVPQDWVEIASRVLANYQDFDGFVVLHGTDTMAWTSSALSYLLEGLSKPVVVTGSQIPIVQTRNDGLRNLVTSVLLAATSKIPESCLFFNMQLMRGNRAVKINSSEFKGFGSPKFPPLAIAGIEISINEKLVEPFPEASSSLEKRKNRNVLAAKLKNIESSLQSFSVVSTVLFPGIQASMVEAIFTATTPPVKGMVLEAFGEGDAPAVKAFLETLAAANSAGVTIVDDTQCLMGSANIGAYESATGLLKAGVISGYDLTPEATLTKLIYLIAQGLSQAEVKKRMQIPLHGDLSLPSEN